jgi:NIMA (never in mitosis gene a)-related kinase 1/4/5
VLRKSDQQTYALKKIKIGNLEPKEKQNALDEIRFLASISSPYIIGYRDAFFEDITKELCIVMDIAEGGDLLDLIKHAQKIRKYIPEKDIIQYLLQICNGLNTLHKLKIVHRDLKCANVFLGKDKKVAKLGDMNVSKVAKN